MRRYIVIVGIWKLCLKNIRIIFFQIEHLVPILKPVNFVCSCIVLPMFLCMPFVKSILKIQNLPKHSLTPFDWSSWRLVPESYHWQQKSKFICRLVVRQSRLFIRFIYPFVHRRVSFMCVWFDNNLVIFTGTIGYVRLVGIIRTLYSCNPSGIEWALPM